MKNKQTKPKTVPQASPPPTPNPLDEIAEFVTDQRALKSALETAESRVARSEAELSEARSALAEAESQRLVEGAAFDPEELDADGNTSPESADFIQASLQLEQARAGRGGCLKRIRDKDVELLSVAEKLAAIRADYNTATVAEFLEQTFAPAAVAFAQVLRHGDALAAALGCSIPELHRLPDRGDWHDDVDAQLIHKQHSQPRNLAESLEDFRRAAESRVLLQERNKLHRAGFDPRGRFEVVREFRYAGREFPQGATVTSHEIDLHCLSQLYTAKRLRLLESREEWSR